MNQRIWGMSRGPYNRWPAKTPQSGGYNECLSNLISPAEWAIRVLTMANDYDDLESGEWHRRPRLRRGRQRRAGPACRATGTCAAVFPRVRTRGGRRATRSLRCDCRCWTQPFDREMSPENCYRNSSGFHYEIEHPGACVSVETLFGRCVPLCHSNHLMRTRLIQNDNKLASDSRERLFRQESLPLILSPSFRYFCSICTQSIIGKSDNPENCT